MITDISTIDNPTWQNRSACLGVDPAIFFNKGNGNTKKAKAICASCPVILKCLKWTLIQEKHTSATARSGIYAGLTPNQRNKMPVCHYGDCLKRVKKHLDFCSEEHRLANKPKPKNPQTDFYKRGSIHLATEI